MRWVYENMFFKVSMTPSMLAIIETKPTISLFKNDNLYLTISKPLLSSILKTQFLMLINIDLRI